MSLLSVDFAALLLTAILLGGMVFFSAGFAPLVFLKLPADQAGLFIRQAFPFYYVTGAVLSLLASMLIAWSFAALALALAGVAFLFALLWLRPAINRNRDRGAAGNAVAQATFRGLHRASVALNAAQIVLVLAAFGLIATGFS